jgi:hypothetical protein
MAGQAQLCDVHENIAFLRESVQVSMADPSGVSRNKQ